MRGVAHLVQERELLMRMRERGKSLAAISRDTGIARAVLSRWWQRYREQGRGGGPAAPPAPAGALAQPPRGGDRTRDFATAGSRLGAGAHRRDTAHRSQQRASRIGHPWSEPFAAAATARLPSLRKKPSR